MHLFFCHARHREHQFDCFFHRKVQFVRSLYFQGWDIVGKYDGCESAIWVLLAKTLLSHCECWTVSLSKPPRKTLWMLISSPLQSIFITCKLLFWRNTVLGSPYWILITKNKLDSKCVVWLRLSLHREQSVDTTSFVEMFSLFQVSPFNSGTLSGNMLGMNLPVVDCWQSSVLTL